MTGTPSTTTKSGSLLELRGGPLGKERQCQCVRVTRQARAEATGGPHCSRGPQGPRRAPEPCRDAVQKNQPPRLGRLCQGALPPQPLRGAGVSSPVLCPLACPVCSLLMLPASLSDLWAWPYECSLVSRGPCGPFRPSVSIPPWCPWGRLLVTK